MEIKEKSKLKSKLWILRFTIFIVMFGYLFVRVSYLFKPVDYSRKSISGYYALEEEIDVVYIGGSSCMTYWAPMQAWNEFGFTSYSFAHESATAYSIKPSLIEIKKTQSPDLVVIDVISLGRFENSRKKYEEVAIRKLADNLNYSLNRLDYINTTVPSAMDSKSSKNQLEYVFDIAKYHTRWNQLSMNSLLYSDNVNHSVSKGYKLLTKVTPIELNDNKNITQEKEFSKEGKEILIEVLEYCKSENLNALFVTNSHTEAPEHRQTYNYLSRIVKSYGYDYINTNDYNDTMGLKANGDFNDRNHVNIFGAEKYTSFLGGYIKNNYLISDKRGEESFSSWNQDHIKWSEEVKKAKKDIKTN